MPSFSIAKGEIVAKWILAFVAKRATLLRVLTWAAVAFSGVLIVLGIFWDRAFLTWGLAGVTWKLTLLLLFLVGWFFMWIRKRFWRRVANGGANIPADPD